MIVDHAYLSQARDQMRQHLFEGLIPFWSQRSVDPDGGGFLTCFDANGQPVAGETDKMLVMQARMVWSFARFSRLLPDRDDLKAAARQGVDFMIAHLWDTEYGGWFWQRARDGSPCTIQGLSGDYKGLYGHAFAIYGLSEYFLATGDPRGLDYAGRTFDVVHRCCADIAHGGYYELFARNWTPASVPFFNAARKSLNTHMHLMEAYTPLVQASGDPVHVRRLRQVIDLILARWINPASGAGYDYCEPDFSPIPANRIAVPSDEQGPRFQPLDQPVLLASYGHDTELAWLLRLAAGVLNQPEDAYLDVMRGLVDHTLRYGVDREYGGIYRDGQHNGPAIVLHKEWWQQAEPLVAFLDMVRLTGESQYLEAFRLTWDFVWQHMIHHDAGEWYTMLTREGKPVRPALGHIWKSAYHTARALAESLARLDMILEA